MRIFWGYVRHHVKSICLFIMFTGIFAGIFALYSLPVEAVAYAAVLCAFAGAVFVTVDFFRYYKKLRILESLVKREIIGMEEIPEGQNLMERAYCNVIDKLIFERAKILLEKDSAKSEMVDYYAIWAHQIKTPIAALGLLLQEEDSDKNKELSSELFKIEQYVGMALSFLRLDSEATDYVIKRYLLDDIVRQAIRKYAPIFIRKKISLELEPLDCEVLTDEKWLSFVIEQLISNALKYTQKGKISVYMKKDGGKTLVIEDTGIGISTEDLPRLCEKGFTGYNGRTDKKATGIGLYLCKRVLLKLSHTIAITSESGAFTRVEVGFKSNLTEM